MADYEVATAIIYTGVMYMVYRGSVDMPEQYWYLKMFMYYASLGLGLAAANTAISFANANGAASDVVTSISNFYYANITIMTIALIVLGVAMLKFVLGSALNQSKAFLGRGEDEE